MATKSTATAEKKPQSEETSDSPLLDTLGGAVKKMLVKGKERGFVTYDELNSALPPEQVSSEQIEDTMTQLSEMGINVVENEDGEEPKAEVQAGEATEKPMAMLMRVTWVAQMILCVCTCVKWALLNCYLVKVR